MIAFHIAFNTIEKGMNPIILPPARKAGWFFSFSLATSLGEGKL